MANQHLDTDALETLKEIMEDDFSLLIETFVSDSQNRLKELQSLLAAGEPDAVRRCAHSMKGSCGNVGALALADLLMQLETLGQSGSLDGASDILSAAEAEFAQVKQVLQAF